ncbi:protein phosphatase 1 regulatory subunit 32 isoform X1 [Myxocyprinus asiaticus]|uniref:protein phosphatase 1 regulatory subunit 32 isoform X1 n=1 Tax=Myxocyprinus asiaticus TaxID=70543 RepID=UPI002223ABB4|nr:protein phosphatase 1 regulatory subunit 32 isoform X1 [Myxocyprinus asiaticus]
MVGPLDTANLSLEMGRPGVRLTNIGLDQYYTTYRQSYGRELFQSCLGHHSSNHRPVLYSSSSLDRYDNPQFGISLMDSLESQSKRHYQRLFLSNATESLACFGSRNRKRGYLQFDPQPRPSAVSLQTEYKGTYIPRRLRVLVGPREESGYTEGTSLQPNTFLPQHINMDDARRTQESVMRTDFLPRSFLQGNEALPKLASRALRETGYTRDTQKPLASSASVQSNSNEDSRLKIRPAEARWSAGPTSSSGFVLNAPNIASLSHTPAYPQHFLTHYQSKFCKQQRANWVRGGIQRQRESV